MKLIVLLALIVNNTAAQNDDGSDESECAWCHGLIDIYSNYNLNVLGCPDDAWYIIQPPNKLNCAPMEGEFIILQCQTNSTEQHGNVTWYWTRCVHNAGVKGTAIEPGDTSDKYGVIMNFTTVTIFFQVTNATLGYYWCKIGNNETSYLRPSTITPVLTNTSLPFCTFDSISLSHNNGSECATEGSPTIYPRVPLPSFCPLVRNA